MVNNSTSKTVEFDSVEGYFHGSISVPLIGADLTVGSATKVNGGNVTAFITGGTGLTISGNKAIFGVYDPSSINLVHIVYHSVGDVFLITINSGFTQTIADTTAPTLVSAYVDVTAPSNIKMLFSEAVYGSSTGFSLSAPSIIGVSGWGSPLLTAQLSGAVQYGDAPTLTYSGNVTDVANNALGNFSVSVVNDLPQAVDPLAIHPWIGAWMADTCLKDVNNIVTGWTDLSGNGNTLDVIGSPVWNQNGIGGQPSIMLDGVNSYLRLAVFSQAPLSNVILSDITICAVFQFDNAVGTGTYSSIVTMGGTSFSNVGANFVQIYIQNSGTAIKFNYPNTDGDIDLSIGSGILSKHSFITRQGTGNGNKFTLDQNTEVSKTPIYNIGLRNLLVGNYNGNGMKGKISALFIGSRITDTELAQLKSFIASKYGI